MNATKTFATSLELPPIDSSNLEDAYINGNEVPHVCYNNTVLHMGEGITWQYYPFIKFNLTQIPSGQVIEYSSLCVYVYDATQDFGTINVYELDNQTWQDDPGANCDNTTLSGGLIATNTTYIGVSKWVCMNVTSWITEQYAAGSSNISMYLYDTYTFGSDSSFFSREYGDTTYRVFLNTTYDVYPTYWSNDTSAPTNYNPDTPSEFNISWNDTLGNQDLSYVDMAFIEINLTTGTTNFTITNDTYGGDIYNLSIVLPAGNYYWKGFANVTSGTENATGQEEFSIGQNTSIQDLINLTINSDASNQSFEFTPILRINASGWNSFPLLSYNLYRNGTLINNENFTNISFPAANYIYTYNTTGNENYTSASLVYSVNITKNTTNPSSGNMSITNFTTNFTNMNISVLTGDFVNISAWMHYLLSGTASIFVDGVSVTNPYVNTIGEGEHEVKINTTGNENYTSNSTGASYYITSTRPAGGGGGGYTETPIYNITNITIMPYCGDGKCDILNNETSEACPLDCKPEDIGPVVQLELGVIAAVAGFVIVKKLKPGRKKKVKGIGKFGENLY